MLRQAPIIIPSFYKYHIISQILSLNLGFLEDYDVGFQYVKHCSKSPFAPPWLILKGVSYAVDYSQFLDEFSKLELKVQTVPCSYPKPHDSIYSFLRRITCIISS